MHSNNKKMKSTIKLLKKATHLILPIYLTYWIIVLSIWLSSVFIMWDWLIWDFFIFRVLAVISLYLFCGSLFLMLLVEYNEKDV